MRGDKGGDAKGKQRRLKLYPDMLFEDELRGAGRESPDNGPKAGGADMGDRRGCENLALGEATEYFMA
jgi:hypothetical protein